MPSHLCETIIILHSALCPYDDNVITNWAESDLNDAKLKCLMGDS